MMNVCDHYHMILKSDDDKISSIITSHGNDDFEIYIRDIVAKL